VAHPLAQRLTDWNDYVGQFTSIDAVDLRPRVSGYLQRLYFKDGQIVRKGQLLFLIDPRPYEAALGQAKAQTARARATLNNAEVELRRARLLLQAQAGSQQDVETRLAAEQQSKADLLAAVENQRAAQLNVDFTRITAPLSGRISDRRVAPGNLVTADTTLLTSIVNQDPIRFEFQVSEALFLQQQRDIGRARAIGDPVDIRLQDEPSYSQKGKLEFIDNALDNNSGIVRMRAVVRNPKGLLTPGLFGHARLPGTAAYQGLLLPDGAVAQDQNRQTVMVVGRDTKVRVRPVQTGPLINGLRVIRSGVTAQDFVVVQGTQKAKPGAKVSPKVTQVKMGKPEAPAPLSQPPASSATLN
jgi:RND family efflux transporter MFP subunit